MSRQSILDEAQRFALASLAVQLTAPREHPTCFICGRAADYVEAEVTVNRYVNGHPDPDVQIQRFTCGAHRGQ